MSDGYYDYEPLLFLDRHLAIGGLVSADTRAVGYRLAALSGLNFLDLERQVEHRTGQSIESTLILEGEEHLRRLEAEALDHLLRDRPFGVLVLGDGALLSRTTVGKLVEQTTLVALEMSLDHCFERCQKRWIESGNAFWHPLFPEALTEVGQVEAYWKPRSASLETARYRIDQARHLGHTAERVARTVPQLRPS